MTDPQTRVAAALAVLDQHLHRRDLERRIGVTMGYLSTCLPGRRQTPSRPLVLLLELLARHPGELDAIAD